MYNHTGFNVLTIGWGIYEYKMLTYKVSMDDITRGTPIFGGKGGSAERALPNSKF
jgi:hypothetical protein